MTESEEVLPAIIEAEKPQNLQPLEPVRIPQYRRDVFPNNVVLSAEDIHEFCELLANANERAKHIEFNSLDLSKFDSNEQARERINEIITLEYHYVANNGDSVEGIGVPETDKSSFPDELKSFFLSNATYAKRAIDFRPLNTVEAFLSFEKPSLKMDFQTLPSNPTENRSVINISGRDEDWVISTTNRINDFFKKRKTTRPMIHGSGTYDYFIYLAFLPALLWLFYKKGTQVTAWLDSQSIFLNVLLGIYALLLSLLVARFVFQYFRWLFPPIEYYKKSRLGAYVHRGVAGLVGTTILLSAGYDILKGTIISLFGW